MHTVDTNKLAEEINRHGTWVKAVKAEMGKVVVGQNQLVDRLLIGLLTNGHVLLEGVPGREGDGHCEEGRLVAAGLGRRGVERHVGGLVSRFQCHR